MTVERSPTDWMILPLKKYAQFSGRAPRAEYWWFAGATLVIGFVADIIDQIANNEMGVLGVVTSLGLLIPTLAVTVRRLHDTDRSGWWMLAAIAPAAYFGFEGSQAALNGTVETWESSPSGLIAIVAFCLACLVILIFTLLRGAESPNRYGPDPYGKQDELEPVPS